MNIDVIFRVIWILFTTTWIFLSNNRICCFLLERKEYKLWKYLQRNVNKIQYDPDTNLYTIDDYRIIIWNDGTSSVFKNDRCILWPYYERHSKKLVKLIKTKFQ